MRVRSAHIGYGMKDIKRYVLSGTSALSLSEFQLPAPCSVLHPLPAPSFPLCVVQTETKRPKTLFSLANNQNLPETNLKRTATNPQPSETKRTIEP